MTRLTSRLPGLLVVALVGVSSADGAPLREPDGGGGEQRGAADATPPFVQAEMFRKAAAARAELKSSRRSQEHRGSDPPLYVWPYRSDLPHPGFDTLTNFLDLNPAVPNQILDYNCGSRSYDIQSINYNHQGVDIATWPFYWYRMDRDEVRVHAAAAGTIFLTEDGNYDRSCGLSNTAANAVYVEHDDGSWAAYFHMKSGSLTTKRAGDRVEAGEFLGIAGSSGSSTYPHLHLETYDRDNNLIEPFAGQCNNLNTESWWQEQRPYYDSRLNQLATHSAPPEFPPCPQTEIPHFAEAFYPGDSVVVAGYFQDQRAGQDTDYRVLKPNGTEFTSWTHRFLFPEFYAFAYWFWTIDLPVGARPGTWTVEATFEGQVVTRQFTVRDEAFAINEGLGGVYQFDDEGRPVQSIGLLLDLVPEDRHPAGINALVGAMFTHDQAATALRIPGQTQRWFTLQGEYDPSQPRAENVPVYQVDQGDFFGTMSGLTKQVGTATVDFYNCTEGAIALQLFDGDIDVEWGMQRTFANDVDECEALAAP